MLGFTGFHHVCVTLLSYMWTPTALTRTTLSTSVNAFHMEVCLHPTSAVSLISWPEESAGLLVFSFPLAVMVAVVREGVDALVAARVAVCVVDDHIVRGDREVDAQLITGQTTLGLGGQRHISQFEYWPSYYII